MPLPGKDYFTPANLPLTPSVDVWRAMSKRAQTNFVDEVNAILNSPLHFMGESIPHNRAKRRATDRLRKHFQAIGRVIFLAEELTVFYPDEHAFTPDILVVRDVPEEEDDERGGWIVADEGRGIDFVLEILWAGDRKKDLEKNVERYARLGIPEYFIYDRKEQRLIGYRLPADQARRYQRIIPQGGRHSSAVLGLDLAVVDQKLEFFHGMAEIFGSDDLIARLESMMNSLEVKAADAEAKAADAEAKAADAEAKIADAQAKIADAQTKAAQAITSLRESIFAIANARGLAFSAEERERIVSCEDLAILQQWLVRVAIAPSMAEVLAAT
jgi:Uma2 family endonuclease